MKGESTKAANGLYMAIDDDPNDLIMEVRRFLYNGQNRGNMV